MIDYSHINASMEGSKTAALAMILLIIGTVTVANLRRRPILKTLWNVFLVLVVLFTIGAWVWSVRTAGAL